MVYECPECGRTTELVATTQAECEREPLYDEGRHLADYMLEEYAGSTCCLAPVENATLDDVPRGFNGPQTIKDYNDELRYG